MRSTSVSGSTWTASAAAPSVRPSRAARSRSCPADSSPEAYRSTVPWPPATPAAASSTSVDLPMPGSPPSSTTRAGHETAPEHTIELVDARRTPIDVLGGQVAQRSRQGRPDDRERARRSTRSVSNDGLDERVPGAAAAALPFPAQMARGAGLADVTALRPRHASEPRRASSPAAARSSARRPRRGRRRSSVRPGSGRPGALRRGDPRPGSGSPDAAGGHRSRRRSRS